MVILSCLAISQAIVLGSAMAADAIRKVEAVILRGRPPKRPLARAAFNPA